MSEQEIKQKLIDNGFGNLIPIFEENHLFDIQALSVMTDSDYQSIGVSVLGDRKKLIYMFQNNEKAEVEHEIDKKEEEFIEIEKNGREYCYKESEPEILLCRKCHHRVFEESTMCSNCNNNLVHSEETSIVKSDYSSSNSSYTQNTNYHQQKTSSPTKIIVPLIVIGILGVMGFFGFKTVNKSNYSAKLKTVYSKIANSSYEAEKCVSLIHSVWYNKIFDKYSSETNKYTKGSYDFNSALDKLFSDSDFKSKINKIKKDSEEIDRLMREMTNPPSEYRDAYVKLNSCYEDYVKLVIMAQSPSGSLTTYTQNFNNLDSSLDSKLKSLELYLK